jgi:hypothetical protein
MKRRKRRRELETDRSKLKLGRKNEKIVRHPMTMKAVGIAVVPVIDRPTDGSNRSG